MTINQLIQKANKLFLALRSSGEEISNYIDLISDGEHEFLKQLSHKQLEALISILGNEMRKRKNTNAVLSSDFYKRALPLAKRGFLVFPIKENQKSPPLVSFTKKATTDIDKIEQWAKQWPNANVGIHCKDLIVVDVDADKGGFKSLKDLGFTLDPTFTVATPNGGHHYYFRHLGGVANGVDVLGKGIDIRSNNGYTVGPGSRITNKEAIEVVYEELE